MPKIVLTHDLGLSSIDLDRLKSLGNVTIFDSRPDSGEEWLKRCKGADIICSGMSGLRDKYQELNNVFISLPYVGVSFLDKEILAKNNIKVSNSPGCNKDAVSEWIVVMIINLLRNIYFFINNNDAPNGKAPEETTGLVDKKILIIGKGNVGVRVGEVCDALKMDVDYFERNDNLLNKIKGKDVLVNCLSSNKTSKNILDKIFFNSLKIGSYFVSVSSNKVYDPEAMFNALDKNILAGAAIDDGLMSGGDTTNPFYQKLLQNPKILATPHVAYDTDVTNKVRNRMMIDNIEAWLKGKPINLINQ